MINRQRLFVFNWNVLHNLANELHDSHIRGGERRTRSKEQGARCRGQRDFINYLTRFH
jgi:hypothetical protein